MNKAKQRIPYIQWRLNFRLVMIINFFIRQCMSMTVIVIMKQGFFTPYYCQRENALAEFLYRRDRLEGVEPTPMAYINVQSDSVFEVEWFLSSRECRASDVLKIDQCQGIVDPNKCLYGMNLYGNFPNRDIWLGDTA